MSLRFAHNFRFQDFAANLPFPKNPFHRKGAKAQPPVDSHFRFDPLNPFLGKDFLETKIFTPRHAPHRSPNGMRQPAVLQFKFDGVKFQFDDRKKMWVKAPVENQNRASKMSPLERELAKIIFTALMENMAAPKMARQKQNQHKPNPTAQRARQQPWPNQYEQVPSPRMQVPKPQAPRAQAPNSSSTAAADYQQVKQTLGKLFLRTKNSAFGPRTASNSIKRFIKDHSSNTASKEQLLKQLNTLVAATEKGDRSAQTRAYRALALQLHPDRQANPADQQAATPLFQLIAELKAQH